MGLGSYVKGLVNKTVGSVGKTTDAIGNAAQLTLSKKLWANPSQVIGSYGDIGQEAANPLVDALRKDQYGNAAVEWTGSHQRELWQVGAAITGAQLGVQAGNLGMQGLAYGVPIATGTFLGAEAVARETVNQRKAELDASTASTPPDINERNDPDLAAQFKRIRKGARMLGRAGTIKYKGAANLGSGQTLGDALALQGS